MVQLYTEMIVAETKEEAAKLAIEGQAWIELYNKQDKPTAIAFHDAVFNGLQNLDRNLTQENLSRLYNFFGRDYVNKRLLRRD